MWMARIVARIERDPTLIAASSGLPPSSFQAARQGNRLLLFVRADAGSLLSAALNQALVRATSPAPLGPELDTTTWSPAELAKWERAPTASPVRTSDASDGRWIWALVLALLGLETWMRSRSRRDGARLARQSDDPTARDIAA
jgi:hypothetical protein